MACNIARGAAFHCFRQRFRAWSADRTLRRSPNHPPCSDLPSGIWSEWYGPVMGPPYYTGICPCKTTLQVRSSPAPAACLAQSARSAAWKQPSRPCSVAACSAARPAPRRPPAAEMGAVGQRRHRVHFGRVCRAGQRTILCERGWPAGWAQDVLGARGAEGRGRFAEQGALPPEGLCRARLLPTRPTQFYPVPAGVPLLNSTASPTGFASVEGTYGAFVDSLNDAGTPGPSKFTHNCPDGTVVVGIDVSQAGVARAWQGQPGLWAAHGCSWLHFAGHPHQPVPLLLPVLQVAKNQTAAGVNQVSGLRFLCGFPLCGAAGGLVQLQSPPPATAAGR